MEGRDGPETCVRAPGLFELLGMERATPGGFIDLVLPWQWSRVHATLSTSVDPCSTPFTLLFGPQSPNDPKPCPPWVVGSANRGCKRGLHTLPPPTGRKKGACQWSLFGGMGGGRSRKGALCRPPPPVPIQCWETHAQPTSSQSIRYIPPKARRGTQFGTAFPPQKLILVRCDSHIECAPQHPVTYLVG